MRNSQLPCHHSYQHCTLPRQLKHRSRSWKYLSSQLGQPLLNSSFSYGHGGDVPLRFQGAKSPWWLCHVKTLLATPSGERCQFNGITAEQSSCERFCLKFISGALVTLLSTVVSQIQRGIDIQKKKGLNQAPEGQSKPRQPGQVSTLGRTAVIYCRTN